MRCAPYPTPLYSRVVRSRQSSSRREGPGAGGGTAAMAASAAAGPGASASAVGIWCDDEGRRCFFLEEAGGASESVPCLVFCLQCQHCVVRVVIEGSVCVLRVRSPKGAGA